MKIAKVIPLVAHSPSLAEAAIEYVRAGFHVFPLHDAGSKKGKQPRIKNWLNRATSNEAQIRRWWEKYPNANIGLLTGSEVGFYALDIDPRHEGDKSLARLIKQHGQLPVTVMQHTGGGGYHYLFRCPNPQRNRTGVLSGIDIKGDGGYIVASPSIHPDTKQHYEWEGFPQKEDIAEPPNWLSSLLAASKPEKCNMLNNVEKKTKTDVIPIGERNDSLFKTGCSLKSSGISNNEIASALIHSNLTECEEPLPADELRALISSVYSSKPKAPYLRYRDWLLSEDCPCDPLCKFILVVLTTFMNNERITAYPSQEKLAEMTGLSRKTVNKKLREAMNKEWIEVSRHKGSTQKYLNYIYQIPRQFLTTM